MNNVYQVLATANAYDSALRAAQAAFIGPVTAKAWELRVGEIIDFRDANNGNRYTGQVLGFGDGVHVGSYQMSVDVHTFNGAYATGVVNVSPDELIAILPEARKWATVV